MTPSPTHKPLLSIFTFEAYQHIQMNYFFLISLLFVSFSSAELVLTTCARMDTPILSKVAQGLCISSCSFQNCATGSCKSRGGRPVCVCNRCANGGGNVGVNVGIGKGRK